MMGKTLTGLQPLLALAQRSVDGYSSAWGTKSFRAVNIIFRITAISAGAILNATITATGDHDASTANWSEIKTIVEMNAVGNQMITVTELEGLSNHLRVAYEISGTSPQITFAIDAVGHED